MRSLGTKWELCENLPRRGSHNEVRLSPGKSVGRTTFEVRDKSKNKDPSEAEFTVK